MSLETAIVLQGLVCFLLVMSPLIAYVIGVRVKARRIAKRKEW